MFGRGAAAAANDGCTAIARQGGVMGHQLGCAVVMNVAIVIFRNARIAFRDDRGLRASGGESQDRS